MTREDRLLKYLDAASRLLNPYERSIEPVLGDRGLGRVQVRGVDEANRQVTGVLSTASVDRYGEVILPTAFESSLPRFMQNPKFVGAHTYATPDGGPTSIGTWADMRVTSDGLVGTAQFLPPGDDLTDRWWFRFLHGAQRTFSVGFLAQAWEMRDIDIDGQRRPVRHFTEAELLEVSAVDHFQRRIMGEDQKTHRG